MSRRPLVVIPARFSLSASALRYQAVVTARALSAAVLAAGGEPLTVHPVAPGGDADPAAAADRLGFAAAVLLPGGGDVAPARYGQRVSSAEVYDTDDEQDGFDLAVARWALAAGMPLLAVCRGMHVVNVALGGTLEQHMPSPHRHLLHQVRVAPGSVLSAVAGSPVTASCYHHQRIERPGTGLVPVAWAEDGTVEAVERPGGPGWFLGVQWHPEDTVTADPAQLAVVRELIRAAR